MKKINKGQIWIWNIKYSAIYHHHKAVLKIQSSYWIDVQYVPEPSLYGNPTAEDLTTHDLPDSAKVLIGVLVAVTLVVTVILVYFSCLIRRKMNELQKQ